MRELYYPSAYNKGNNLHLRSSVLNALVFLMLSEVKAYFFKGHKFLQEE